MNKAFSIIKFLIALFIVLVALSLVIFPVIDAVFTFFDIVEYAIVWSKEGWPLDSLIKYTIDMVYYFVIDTVPHAVYAILAGLLGGYFMVDSLGGLIKKSPKSKKTDNDEAQQ